MGDKCKSCSYTYPHIECVNCGDKHRNYKPHRKQTNAESIRSMSDEELAKIITAEPIAEEIPFCKNLPQREIDLDSLDGIPQERCVQCALDWLRQPAKEETE